LEDVDWMHLLQDLKAFMTMMLSSVGLLALRGVTTQKFSTWMHLAQNRGKHSNESSGSINGGEILD
jgi:hypothetical protein